MSYRINTQPKPHGVRTVIDTTTPAHFYITNGSIAEFAIPCWYQEIHKPVRAHHHNHHLHDHQGWPAPDHPDHCCQLWIPDVKICALGYHRECSRHCEHYVDMSMLIPIHLKAEGYTMFSTTVLTFDGKPLTDDSVAIETSVLDNEDWVIRLKVSAQDSKAINHPVEYKIAVRAGNNDGLIDTVVVAKLVVMPAALEGEM